MTTDLSAPLPDKIIDVAALEELLSRPNAGVAGAMGRLKGDILVLGVAGKMGPTLARMALRGSQAAGVKRQVIGVARFSNPAEQQNLEKHGIATIKADLLDEKALAQLPDAPNVIFMAGMKFGSTGKEALTWAMNTYLPGRIAQRFAQSKIVVFSTGNIYGLAPITQGGSIESDPLNPIGDYAMSCMGRERMFDHFSRTLRIPTAFIRLNYATELRYGTIVDLALKIWQGQEIDLAMGNFNAIWQTDANAMTLQAFDHLSSPPWVLNVAGPEILSVRRVCEQLGQLMSKTPRFTGVESTNALLNNGQMGHRLFGYPSVSAQQMLHWIADWVKAGGAMLGKPTHFEARDGKF